MTGIENETWKDGRFPGWPPPAPHISVPQKPPLLQQQDLSFQDRGRSVCAVAAHLEGLGQLVNLMWQLIVSVMPRHRSRWVSNILYFILFIVLTLLQKFLQVFGAKRVIKEHATQADTEHMAVGNETAVWRWELPLAHDTFNGVGSTTFLLSTSSSCLLQLQHLCLCCATSPRTFAWVLLPHQNGCFCLGQSAPSPVMSTAVGWQCCCTH